MKPPYQFYLKHLHSRTGYRASWLPDQNIKIGDIGKMEKGVFTRLSTLNEMGIEFRVSEAPSSLDLDYSSKESLTIDITSEATASQGKGKVVIGFGKEDGLIFQITNSKLETLTNLADIEGSVLAKYRDESWPISWVIITEVVTTEYATIIISSGSNSSITLECTGNFPLVNQSLANPKLKFNVVAETGNTTKILGKSGLTPLFKIRGVRDPFLSKPTVNTRSGSHYDSGDLIFKRLDFNEAEFNPL